MTGKPPVAVLGANGFIGGSLCRWLQERGHETIGWTSRDCDLTDALEVKQKLASLPAGVRLVMCATVNRYVEDSYRAMGRNLLMAENLIDGAPRGRIGGLVFLSTVDVYGHAPVCPITEATAPRPMNYYGIGKLASEHLLRRPGAIDCPVTVLRLPGVYGPTDNQRSIVGAFLRRIVEGREITLYGDGQVQRDYVDVDDVCGIVAGLLAEPRDSLLNIAKGESLSLKQRAKKAKRQVSHPVVQYWKSTMQARSLPPGATDAAPHPPSRHVRAGAARPAHRPQPRVRDDDRRGPARPEPGLPLRRPPDRDARGRDRRGRVAAGGRDRRDHRRRVRHAL